MLRSTLTLAVAALAVATPSLALADAIDDPCQVETLGAPCTDRDGEAGTCVEGELGDLVCSTYDPCEGKQEGAYCATIVGQEPGTCRGGSAAGLTCVADATAGTTTTGGGTTATTAGAGGSGGDDDGGAGGGTSGGSTEDDGCAVKAPGKKSATRGGAAAIFLAAAALTTARAIRRARRSSTGS